MISMDMFILTRALQSVVVDPPLLDASNNKSGPSFKDLDRMEDFWSVSIFLFSRKYCISFRTVSLWLALFSISTSTWNKLHPVHSSPKPGTIQRMFLTMATFYTRTSYSDQYRCARRKFETTHVWLLMTSKKKSNSATIPMHLLWKKKQPLDLVKILTIKTALITRKSFITFLNRIWNAKFVYSRFKYTPSQSWFSLSTTGHVSVYDQGGYIQNFGSSADTFQQQISYLKQK